ncbi:hypothetical protein E2562_024133 [Oryza meyeriana var. granulata]|uniref:Xylanase inhibitor N-terminal domain-containing protein n=1 Tax=Oryza meyeriana var. granulata TaxID=110450 RepID=A0A6G1EP63_9ORYZ|nr:hypothetical protein E2562_024133 [Oryza meyeriana var. granulata]
MLSRGRRQPRGDPSPSPGPPSGAAVLLYTGFPNLHSGHCPRIPVVTVGSMPSLLAPSPSPPGREGVYCLLLRPTPPPSPVPVKAVLDLAGTMLWVDYYAGYVSSSHAGVPCGSKACRLMKNVSYAINCLDAPSSGCFNDTCSEFPKNTATGVGTASNILTGGAVTAHRLPSHPVPGPVTFLFTCSHTFLTEGLTIGATDMVSLSRARFTLPTQLTGTFRFSRKVTLCLPLASTVDAVVFGDEPYVFQPRGGIKVNGRAVPLNATLLAINKKGVGGTKLSTVFPYTVLETSIHKGVTDAFLAETAMQQLSPGQAY